MSRVRDKKPETLRATAGGGRCSNKTFIYISLAGGQTRRGPYIKMPFRTERSGVSKGNTWFHSSAGLASLSGVAIKTVAGASVLLVAGATAEFSNAKSDPLRAPIARTSARLSACCNPIFHAHTPGQRASARVNTPTRTGHEAGHHVLPRRADWGSKFHNFAGASSGIGGPGRGESRTHLGSRCFTESGRGLVINNGLADIY